MSTIDKALSLLGQFDHNQPEFGLSELSRLSGYDKATTLRLARSLVSSGLLEQDPVSKRYRLGAEILRLANLREGLYPLRTIAQPIVNELAIDSAETVHVTARTSDKLGTVLAHESAQTVRVVVEPGLQIPWHVTASGFALLAQLPPTERKRLLDISEKAFPGIPVLDHNTVQHDIDSAIRRGYAVSVDRMEHGVAGVASAFFDNRNMAVGSVAVALSSATLTPEREHDIAALVVNAAAKLSRLMGASSHLVSTPAIARSAS